MEKRETGKIITIKINGKKQDFEESRQQSDRKTERPLDKKKVESSKVSLENLDEFKSLSAEAAAAAQEESFDWILPEPSENPEIKEFHIAATETSSQKKKKSFKLSPFGKRNGHFFKTIITAVFLAVIIGTSFGLIMLKFVKTETAKETTTVQEPVKQTEQPTDTQGKTPAGTNSLVLPKISTFVVQEGAYTSKESAENHKQTLQKGGSAAEIIEENGKSLLLLSVVDSKEHAKELQTRFKASGVESFGKQVEIGGKEVTGLKEEEKTFLEALPLLFQTMAAAGANASLTSDIPQTLIESIDQQAKKLSAIEEKQLSNEQIKSLKASTDKAVKQVKAMEGKAAAKDITALQQNLLSILATYQAL